MISDLSLEERIARLEAEGDIQRLKAEYAGLCDRGYPGRELSMLFTDDAVWDGGDQFGVHTGRKAIEEFFDGASGLITWALHYMIGPSITIDPNLKDATGTWYLWQPCTQIIDDTEVATWICGKYSDSYQNVNGRWLFSRVSVVYDLINNVDESWISAPFIGQRT